MTDRCQSAAVCCLLIHRAEDEEEEEKEVREGIKAIFSSVPTKDDAILGVFLRLVISGNGQYSCIFF